MHRRVIPGLASAAAAGLALTGCIVQPPPIVATADERWRVDARLVSYPQIVGDLAIAYESDGDDHLAVTAWTSDGTEAWSVPSAPLLDGYLADLVPLADGTIPIVTPVDGGTAWAAIDVATGTGDPVTTRTDGSSAVWPRIAQTWRCAPGDDLTSLCFAVDDGSGTHADFLRFTPGTGIDLIPYPSTTATIYATDRGVYTEEATQSIELLVDGTRRWTRPWVDVFAAPYLDGGFEMVQHGDTLVLSTFAGWTTGSSDATGYESTAIDVASGAVLWQAPGWFPCTDGADLVLCAATGDGTYGAATFESIDVRGVDVRTGADVWTLEVGEAGVAVENDPDAWTWYGSTLFLALGDDGTPTIVDAATGGTAAVPADAALPCTIGDDESLAFGDDRVTLSASVAWCDTDLQAVADPVLRVEVVEAMGLPFGDVLLVPEAGALVAYGV